MYISDKWADYELLDASSGERLERWGSHVLIRPDPQIIWTPPRLRKEWKNAAARYVRSGNGGGKWEKNNLPENWIINYGDLRFRVRPTGFKHTGLFPEQAVNWDYIRNKILSAERRTSVLNLFAYTGGATLAAASAGASVCHVDAARGMTAWARENAKLSGLEDRPVRWIVDDCVKFLEREIKRGRRYDAVMMDPPSYGRGPGGETWKLEDDLYKLVSLAADVLSDEPVFVLINSYTTGLSPSALTYISELLLSKRFGGRARAEELGLPVADTGLFLPCGAAMRWETKWR